MNPSGTRETHKCTTTTSSCDVCNYIVVDDVVDDSFSSHVTGTSYSVNQRLDCNLPN